MGGTLRERRRDETRTEIQRAALDLFERKGYEATTVEDIAAAVGMASRTFFRYFDSKTAVVLHANHADETDHKRKLIDAVAGRPASETPGQAMAAVLRQQLTKLADDDDMGLRQLRVGDLRALAARPGPERVPRPPPRAHGGLRGPPRRLHRGARPPGAGRGLHRDHLGDPGALDGHGRRARPPARHDRRGLRVVGARALSQPGDGGPVVDFWVNGVDPRRFLPSMTASAQPPGSLPGVAPDGRFEVGRFVEDTVAVMDRNGVDQSIVSTGLMADGREAGVPSLEELAEATGPWADRFLLAAMPDGARDPVGQVLRLRALATEGRFALLRVVPMIDDIPLDDRRWYPLYAASAELGLPVSVNVGVPGFATRTSSQHPERLPDVLCDLPGLHVIAAHMGHPHEPYLVALLRLFPQLALATTLFWPRRIHPDVLAYMQGDGRGRVIWGSDVPAMDVDQQLIEARALPLDDDARAAYLGGAWRAVRAPWPRPRPRPGGPEAQTPAGTPSW